MGSHSRRFLPSGISDPAARVQAGSANQSPRRSGIQSSNGTQESSCVTLLAGPGCLFPCLFQQEPSRFFLSQKAEDKSRCKAKKAGISNPSSYDLELKADINMTHRRSISKKCAWCFDRPVFPLQKKTKQTQRPRHNRPCVNKNDNQQKRTGHFRQRVPRWESNQRPTENRKLPLD